MKYLFLIFLLNGFYSHDIQVAFFTIHQENENFTMEIIMERDNVESTFDALDINLTDKNFKDYLHENISLSINQEKQVLCFESMQKKNKHITLTCNILELKDKIQSIEVSNTCLLNIENHSNIIEINVNDIERDFLMNKERTSILVEY